MQAATWWHPPAITASPQERAKHHISVFARDRLHKSSRGCADQLPACLSARRLHGNLQTAAHSTVSCVIIATRSVDSAAASS